MSCSLSDFSSDSFSCCFQVISGDFKWFQVIFDQLQFDSLLDLHRFVWNSKKKWNSSSYLFVSLACWAVAPLRRKPKKRHCRYSTKSTRRQFCVSFVSKISGLQPLDFKFWVNPKYFKLWIAVTASQISLSVPKRLQGHRQEPVG